MQQPKHGADVRSSLAPAFSFNLKTFKSIVCRGGLRISHADGVLMGWRSDAGFEKGGMVRPERFELPTYCSGGNRSIQLSYGRAQSGYRNLWIRRFLGPTHMCGSETRTALGQGMLRKKASSRAEKPAGIEAHRHSCACCGPAETVRLLYGLFANGFDAGL